MRSRISPTILNKCWLKRLCLIIFLSLDYFTTEEGSLTHFTNFPMSYTSRREI